MITNKTTPELFDTIAVGDHVETWDGVWGTVTAVDFHSQTIWDGSEVIFEATFTIASDNLRTYDSWGWPKSYSGTIIRRVRKYYSDLRWAYTPGTVPVPNGV